VWNTERLLFLNQYLYFLISLLVDAEGSSLVPNGKVILVPFEADLKVMVLSNDFEDCIG
jgi:hypothetical protein